MTGLVTYQELNVPQALAIAVDKIGLPWLNYIVKFGAVAGLSAVIIVSQYTVIRMLLVMAEDNLLPSIFAQVHNKNQTPHIITLVIGLSMSFIAATTNLQNIVKLSSFFILLTLIVICISTIVMRYNKPELNRGFYCPLMPITPTIAILLSTYILSSYPIQIYIKAGMVLMILTFLYFIQKKLNTNK